MHYARLRRVQALNLNRVVKNAYLILPPVPGVNRIPAVALAPSGLDARGRVPWMRDRDAHPNRVVRVWFEFVW